MRLPEPWITIPSSRSSMLAPKRDSSVTVVLMRSDSLTRNSAASLMVVVPLAKHAATAMTGNSSRILGIVSPPISMPVSSPEVTRRSATGSPPSIRWSTKLRLGPAPIACKASIIPVRLGFSPIPRMRTWALG